MAGMDRHTFFVRNLGCRVNRVESDTIAAALMGRGAQPSALADAEVVIVNSCTVTGEASAKTRQAIRHSLAGNASAPVIVTGCAAAIDPDSLRSLGKRVIVEPDKSRVAPLAWKIIGTDTRKTPASGGAGTFARSGDAFMARAGIKVQDGCDNACTYCIVHIARGPLWSKDRLDVVREVRIAEKSGIREVVLTGINLGRYDGGCSLAELIEDVLEQTDEVRIRLSSIEPPDIDGRLMDVMAGSAGRVCRYLHLPLQSGCDTTLHEMGRLYDTAFFRDLAGTLRARVPGIMLSTDIMAGFPGERDGDFEESFGFCREMGFSKMHVFRYSPRPLTPAAKRPDQVPADVKAERAFRLRALGDEMRARCAGSLVGGEECLCMTGEDVGVAERYFPARIEGGTGPGAQGAFGRGALVKVRVTGNEDDVLVCQAL